MSEVASHGVMGSRRVIAAGWWSAGLCAVFVTLITLAASAGPRETNAACLGPFTIDFEGLPAGTIIGEQYASLGVHISGVANEGFPDALIVFDTSAPPTHDPDLAVDIGNIAIFANNLTDSNGDGLVDDPDENNFGGTATFAFDQDVSIGSVKWIDKDHGNPNFVVAYNAAGDVLVSVPVPLGANASVQTIPVNADGVRRLEFVYHESGGFTGIEVECGAPTPTPAATTPPTSAATTSPTPAVAGATATPAPIVAAVNPAVQQTPAVLAVAALPAGGGPPGSSGAFPWAAALLAAASVITSGSFVLIRSATR
jgi:hypothetical protein